MQLDCNDPRAEVGGGGILPHGGAVGPSGLVEVWLMVHSPSEPVVKKPQLTKGMELSAGVCAVWTSRKQSQTILCVPEPVNPVTE